MPWSLRKLDKMRCFTTSQQTILLATALTILLANILGHLTNPPLHISSQKPNVFHQYAVEVCGTVCKQGIYLFEEKPTIRQAIRHAQGPAKFFPSDIINKKILQSGISIDLENTFTNPTVLISNMEPRKQIVLGIPFNLNKATKNDLCLVPGISHTLAQRIVNYRATQGAFKTWHTLKKVRGLGPQTLRMLAPYLHI